MKRINVPGMATMAAGFAVWEAVIRSGLVEYRNLPAPSAVFGSAGGLLRSGELITHSAHTLGATLLGWGAASLIGIALGLLLGLSSTARSFSMSSIEFMKAIPPITLVPLGLLVFGFSIRLEIALIIYVAVWPVLVNSIGGVQAVRVELLDVARILRMSRPESVKKIILPAAMPSIVVGLRLALSLSLVLAVVTEMVGNPKGLGNALIRSQQALLPEQMFAYVIAIGLCAVALNACFGFISSKTLPGTASGRGSSSG